MKKKSLIALLTFALIVGGTTIVYTCAIDSTFRAYLDRRFWQPFSKFAGTLMQQTTSSEEERPSRPFAGRTADHPNPVLRAIGDAYRLLPHSRGSYPQSVPAGMKWLCAEARAAIAVALQADLTEAEREEVRLVDAKIDMREGENQNHEALLRAREKLSAFLSTAQTPAFASEARGWFARVHYLLGDYAPAAKIYLDEMSIPDSIFSRESLLTSLRNLFPYNGSSSRLAEHLDEYFDTPTHALFVVTLVTNPVYVDKEERRAMAAIGKQVIAVLQNHRELFRSGTDSEALTLALMRAALYMGDTKAALAYSQLMPAKSASANSSEFNWMTAACHFLQQNYAAAEAPLLRMYRSQQADDRDRSAAAQGLIGVYQKLGRGADQLHAAFLYFQARAPYTERNFSARDDASEEPPYIASMSWSYAGWLIDLPYLLDIQLTNQELRAYLTRYGRSREPIWQTGRYNQPHHRSAPDIANYALAVRHARREAYAQAAVLYRQLGSWPRAVRMQKLAKLYVAANDHTQTSRQQMEAQYTYAAFLADHPDGIFFNDMLWGGLQREAFIKLNEEQYPGGPVNTMAVQGLTRHEREFFLQRERKVRDEQEERWRAYKILSSVVEEAGPSALGRRAAQKAFDCLVRINTERFGRADEIHEGLRRLATWLRKYPVRQASVYD